MRVLVTWGSKLGGTAEIGQTIARELEQGGFEVVARSASGVRDLAGFDAAVIGGAIYANLWHADAYRLATRNLAALRRIPVWLFSSGPLDDSAERAELPAPKQVAVLAERLGALGHVTFGGRLPADVTGFPAAAMAKEMSGDWRNMDSARTFAAEIAAALPGARPGPAHEPPAGSLWRLAGFGILGWVLCAGLMALLQATVGMGWALALHAIGAPVIFAVVSVVYFRAHGARDPLPTAVAFTAIVALLDAVVVAGIVLRSFDMFTSVVGTWLPFALIFAATWATGRISLMMPTRGQSDAAGPPATAKPA